MEIKKQHTYIVAAARIACCMVLMLGISMYADSQPPSKYSVKDGKMIITLNKDIPEDELKSFIRQFDLQSLALDRFLKNGFADSLNRAGWRVDRISKVDIAISKVLGSFDNINNPAARILFTSGEIPADVQFPSVSNMVKYGYNRFRSKSPFVIKDSMVRFFLRGHSNAKRVILAGSFNNWDENKLAMQRTDSGWIAGVKLRPGKYWYKFIIDGDWITDPDNRNNENDAVGHTNSVFYYTNIIFRLNGFLQAKKVILSGSFNNWNENELVMEKTATGWQLPLYLAEGTHTYRFIADQQWITDPGNPDKFPNEFGDYNSVVAMGAPHIFKLADHDNAKKIAVTGSFNGWREDELFMKKTSTGWELPYVLGPGNYQYRFIIDGRSVTDPANPPMINDGKTNSILVLQPNYTFRLKGYRNAWKVFLAGDFNDWSARGFLMKKEKDDWLLTVHLSAGKHVYKFIVDGNWIIDPSNELWEENEFRTRNSVIWREK